MTRRKRIPQRTCVVCRQTRDKRALIRVVRTPEGVVMVDPSGKANGRGAYLCRQLECLEIGPKAERLAQALKLKLSSEAGAALITALQAERSKV